MTLLGAAVGVAKAFLTPQRNQYAVIVTIQMENLSPATLLPLPARIVAVPSPDLEALDQEDQDQEAHQVAVLDHVLLLSLASQ